MRTKALSTLVVIMLMFTSSASAAWINPQPRADLTSLALLFGVFLIIMLTAAGGGYKVLWKSAKSKIWMIIKAVFIAIAVLILLSIVAMVPSFAYFAGLMLSLYAGERGIKMMKWRKALQKEEERQAHLDKADPKKLKTAGLLLVFLTPIVVFCGIFFGLRADWAEFREKAAARINADAQDAYKAAKVFLKENPKATVTCENMKAMGYEPTEVINAAGDRIGAPVYLSCASNVAATSGQITITGQQRWGLKKPVASITYSGMLTPAER